MNPCIVLKQVVTQSGNNLLSTTRRHQRKRVLPQWSDGDGCSNNDMIARQFYHCGPIFAVGITSISLIATTIRQSRRSINKVLPLAAVLRGNDRLRLLLLRLPMIQQRSLATNNNYKWDKRPKSNKKKKKRKSNTKKSSSSSPQMKALALSSLHTTFDLMTYRGFDAEDDVSDVQQSLQFNDAHVADTDRDTSLQGASNPLLLHDTSTCTSVTATDLTATSASDTIISHEPFHHTTTTALPVPTTSRTPTRPNDARAQKITENRIFHPKNRTCPKCHRTFGGHFRMLAHLSGTRRCLVQCDVALQRELRMHVSHVVDTRAIKRDDRKLKRYTNGGRQHQDLIHKYHARPTEGNRDAGYIQDVDNDKDDVSDSKNVNNDDRGGLKNQYYSPSKTENDNM